MINTRRRVAKQDDRHTKLLQSSQIFCPSSGGSVNTAFTSAWSHFQHFLVFNVNWSHELYGLFIAMWSVHLVEILPTLHFPVRNRYSSTFWSSTSIGHASFMGCLLSCGLSIWWRFCQHCIFRCVIIIPEPFGLQRLLVTRALLLIAVLSAHLMEILSTLHFPVRGHYSSILVFKVY